MPVLLRRTLPARANQSGPLLNPARCPYAEAPGRSPYWPIRPWQAERGGKP